MNLTKTIDRAQKSQRRAINSFGFGSSAEGAALVESYYSSLAAHVKKQLRFHSRFRSLPETLWLVIKELDPDKLAVAVLTALMHSIWQRNPEERSPALKAKLLIGRAIRRQCLHRELLQSDRELLKKINKAAAREPDLKRRDRVVERQIKAASFKKREWTDTGLAVAGNWALEAVLCALPDVFTHKGGAPLINEEAVLQAATLAEAVLLKHPVYSPHTALPKPWTDWENEDGATFVRNARSENSIKLAIRKGTMVQHVDGINSLQAVAWTINERVLEVIEKLDPSDKILKLGGRSGRGIGGEKLLECDIETARQLAGAPFWTPMNCDWRGRAYTLSHFGFWREDRVRALFLFNDGQPIGSGLYWLKLHVANCGDFNKISKRPLDERVQWTEAHIAEVLRIAAQPMTSTWWREADQPFQFLAACFELAAALSVGPAFVTRLPVGFDGSANGVQHLAAMMRAEDEGALVNLIPQTEPSDLYEVIAGKLKERLKSRYHKYAGVCFDWGIDRKLVKRPTMTFPYSATQVGMRKQLIEVLGGQGSSPDVFKAAHWLAGQVLATVEGVLKRSADAMDFMKKCAEMLAEQNKAVKVISPTGFPLINQYARPRTRRIKLWLFDKAVRSRLADGFKPKILKRKVKNGISPNITHMVDSSHLMMTVNTCVAEGITNVAAIHDSFNCLASEADRFNAIIREQFVKLHTEHDILEDIRKAVVRELGDAPPIPQRGTLDVNEILKADFAFS